MNHHKGQTSGGRRSLKRKLESGFQERARACKALAADDPDEDGYTGSTPVQSSSSTTSTSFSRPHLDYDVFLSFRGESTRKNFVDHLYNALKRIGIHTFRDEEELKRGTTILTEILRAIRKSKMYIVVFCKDYASSSWCLDELVEILRCRKIMGHTLLPIFYHVDPSDVRKQTGSFAEAFVRHEQRFHTEMERVRRWRVALTEAANFSGWDLTSLANGYESSFINKIVTEVFHIMKPNEVKVAKHPVGINYNVDKIVDLLNLGTNDVCIVGIYGMGGIGKTTLAKAVYNQIHYWFEGSSCLLNIKQNSNHPKGLVHLQKQLLYDILKIKDLKIANVDDGLKLIEERIYGKKVLIVLDDVDDPKQLYELLGSSKEFGSGSRIIATTRDEVMLANLKVHGKYKVKELGEKESFKLFNLNAFNTSYPLEDFMGLSIRAVKYCKGLPLALEVLGSSLIGRSVADWKIELDKLQRTPHPKIQEVLRMSFESLDDTTKNIFLDIACFFVGKDKDYVIKVLDGCDFFLNDSINTLIRRSLVTIDLKNKLKMHDLVRDMGRRIVQEESLNYPENRSRLWFHEDILNVLHNHTGTKTLEGIISNVSVFKDAHFETKAFTNMKRLRLLQINGVHLVGSYEYLSKELRLLCWHKCPLKFLPHNFYLENLIILDMQHSNIQELWKNKKKLIKLKVLNLKDCINLTKSPNFSQFPQLEILTLEGCISLVQVHESIGDLERLVSLNLGGCKKLWNLPSIISNLKSLEILILSGCLKLQKLPEDLGNNMKALKKLLADGTAIKQLPYSIVSLKNLETLLLSGCEEKSSKSLWSHFLLWMLGKRLKHTSFLPTFVSGLHSLKRLSLSGRNLSEDGIPCDLGSLCSLTELDLSRNNFRILPDCISRLPKLNVLCLSGCTTLQSIFGVPASVGLLEASGCTSMERLLISPSRRDLQLLYLYECPKLTEIQGLERLECPSYICTDECNNLPCDFWSQIQCPSTLGDDQFRHICCPGRAEVPNWFSHQSNGSSISFHMPSIPYVENLRLLFCVAYKPILGPLPLCLLSMIIHNKSRGYTHICRLNSILYTLTPEDHVFLYQSPPISSELEMESGAEIEVSVRRSDSMEVKKWGVHVLIIEPNRNEEYETMVTNGDSGPSENQGHNTP